MRVNLSKYYFQASGVEFRDWVFRKKQHDFLTCLVFLIHIPISALEVTAEIWTDAEMLYLKKFIL